MLVRVLAVGRGVRSRGCGTWKSTCGRCKNARASPLRWSTGKTPASVGLTPEQAWRIYDAGADVVTLGNHTFGKMQIADFLDDTPGCCGPPISPAGRRAGGCGVRPGGVRIRVMNLIGRCDLSWERTTPSPRQTGCWQRNRRS